jgi:hypothetical protein
MIKSNLLFYQVFSKRTDNLLLAKAKLAVRNFQWKNNRPIKVVGVFSVNNWESVFNEALGELGSYIHITWPHIHDFFAKKSDWVFRRQELNQYIQDEFQKHYVEEENIIVFIYSSDFIITQETIAFMKRQNAMVISFCWDDLLYFKGKVNGQLVGINCLSRFVDLNFTFSPEVIPRYNFYHSPCFFWEGVPLLGTFPVSLPDHTRSESEFYVLFIGSRYGWRASFLEQLQKKGLQIKCYGKGWENGSLDSSQMKIEIRNAPLTIGFAGVGYTQSITTIKGRDFEVPSYGGLYLTQHSRGLEKIYDIGKEVLCYSDLDDCFNKICIVRDNVKLADSIRIAGYQKAIQTCTWTSRMKYLHYLINHTVTA